MKEIPAEMLEQAISEEDNYRAEEAFNRAVQRDADDLEGKFKDVTEAIRLNPQYAAAFWLRGLIFSQTWSFDGAINDFNQVIALAPEFAEVYPILGVLYQLKDMDVLALDSFNEAIRIMPNNPEFYKARVYFYGSRNAYKLAISDYNEAIRLNPFDAEAYCERGGCYRHIHEIEFWDESNLSHAISDLTKAIRLKPDYVQAYHERGLALKSKVYQNEVRRHFDGTTTFLNIFRGSDRSNHSVYDTVLSDFNKAIELNPNSAEVYKDRGKTLELERMYREAINDY